jgi:hypothetical protein
VRDVLAWVIQGAGYAPVTAGGVEGFELLDELADRVALVILDLSMHGMDGFRFRELQRAEPRLADIPTIVMSGGPCCRRRRCGCARTSTCGSRHTSPSFARSSRSTRVRFPTCVPVASRSRLEGSS